MSEDIIEPTAEDMEKTEPIAEEAVKDAEEIVTPEDGVDPDAAVDTDEETPAEDAE